MKGPIGFSQIKSYFNPCSNLSSCPRPKQRQTELQFEMRKLKDATYFSPQSYFLKFFYLDERLFWLLLISTIQSIRGKRPKYFQEHKNPSVIRLAFKPGTQESSLLPIFPSGHSIKSPAAQKEFKRNICKTVDRTSWTWLFVQWMFYICKTCLSPRNNFDNNFTLWRYHNVKFCGPSRKSWKVKISLLRIQWATYC